MIFKSLDFFADPRISDPIIYQMQVTSKFLFALYKENDMDPRAQPQGKHTF